MQINYNQHKYQIRKLAYYYHHKTEIEVDELISAANEEFIKIQKTFDPSKACFNTYLYIKLRGLFISMGKKRQTVIRRESTLNTNDTDNLNYWVRSHSKIKNRTTNVHNNITPEKICIFRDIIKELPNDAKEVIKIVFETPVELMNMLPKKQPRGINKRLITQYLRTKEWTFPKIWKAFDDIKAIWS